MPYKLNSSTSQASKLESKFNKVPSFKDVDWADFFEEWKSVPREKIDKYPSEIRKEIADQSWNHDAFKNFTKYAKFYLIALETLPEHLENREMIALEFFKLYWQTTWC